MRSSKTDLLDVLLVWSTIMPLKGIQGSCGPLLWSCAENSGAICRTHGAQPASHSSSIYFLYCPEVNGTSCHCLCSSMLTATAILLGICGSGKDTKADIGARIKQGGYLDELGNVPSTRNGEQGSTIDVPSSKYMYFQHMPYKNTEELNDIRRTWLSRSLLSSGSDTKTDKDSEKRGGTRLRRPAYFGGGVRGPLPRPGSYHHDDMIASKGQGRRLTLSDPSPFPGSAIAALVLILVIILMVIALLLYS